MVVFWYVFTLLVLNPKDGVGQGTIEGTDQRKMVLGNKVMMGLSANSGSRCRYTQSILGAEIGVGSLPGSKFSLGLTSTPGLVLNYICSTLLCSCDVLIIPWVLLFWLNIRSWALVFQRQIWVGWNMNCGH